LDLPKSSRNHLPGCIRQFADMEGWNGNESLGLHILLCFAEEIPITSPVRTDDEKVMMSPTRILRAKKVHFFIIIIIITIIIWNFPSFLI